MRRFVFGVLTVVCLASLGLAVPSRADDRNEKVTICHFAGHDGDYLVEGGPGPVGDHPKCESLDGNLIIVSIDALCAHLSKCLMN